MNKPSNKSHKTIASSNKGYAITADQFHRAESHRIIDSNSSELIKMYSLGDDARDAFLCVLPVEGGFIAWHHDEGYSIKALGVNPRRCLHCIDDNKFVEGRIATTKDFQPEAVTDVSMSRIVCAMVGTMFYDLVAGKTVFCSLEILESMQYGLKFFKRFQQFPRFFAIDTEIVKRSNDNQ